MNIFTVKMNRYDLDRIKFELLNIIKICLKLI